MAPSVNQHGWPSGVTAMIATYSVTYTVSRYQNIDGKMIVWETNMWLFKNKTYTTGWHHLLPELWNNLILWITFEKFFFLDIRFAVHSQIDCNRRNNIYVLPDDGATDQEDCKIWCANNAICWGFVFGNWKCWFKDATCLNNAVYHSYAVLYRKETN